VPLDLLITKNRIAACLQHQECKQMSHTPVCMHMQYTTSRAAAKLIKESKGLLKQGNSLDLSLATC